MKHLLMKLTIVGIVVFLSGCCELFNTCEDDSLSAQFNVDKTEVVVGEKITFTSTSKGTPDKFVWSFPEGNPSNGNGESMTVRYNEPGTYSASLSIEKGDKSDTKTIHELITVTGQNPQADFYADKRKLKVGESVIFHSISEGNPDKLNWTFDGGVRQNSSDLSPKVKYDNPGEFTVVLQASNKYGTHTKTKPGFVEVIPEYIEKVNVIINITNEDAEKDCGFNISLEKNSINLYSRKNWGVSGHWKRGHIATASSNDISTKKVSPFGSYSFKIEHASNNGRNCRVSFDVSVNIITTYGRTLKGIDSYSIDWTNGRRTIPFTLL